MKLVIFDIDGTLTRTNEADEACFAGSVKEAFAIENISTDWGSYEHSTDSGILDELLRRHRQCTADEAELEKFRDIFVRNLQNYYQTVPGSFEKVKGAGQLFHQIRELGRNWLSAIATGGWKKSAHLKLSRAGLDVSELPRAYADDHFSRDEIVLQAIRRSQTEYGQTKFEKIVYVGDGRWDLLTTQRLGIGFVGIHDNRDPKPLYELGAKTVLPHYGDMKAFLEAIERA